MPGNLLWSRVGRITVPKCVGMKWALFFDGEPSKVSVLWATWIPGAGSLDCCGFSNQTRQRLTRSGLFSFSLSYFLFQFVFSLSSVTIEQNIPYLTFIFIKAWIENFKWAPFIFLLFWKSNVHDGNLRDGRENSHYREPLHPWCLSLHFTEIPSRTAYSIFRSKWNVMKRQKKKVLVTFTRLIRINSATKQPSCPPKDYSGNLFH